MKSRQIAYWLLVSAFVVAAGVPIAIAKDAPKDNKGLTVSKTTVVELGSEIAGMEGWSLRQRLFTIEPGGHIGIHSHKDRPAVAYFVQGTVVVTRDDGSSQTFHAGDTTAETKDATHWHRNVGTDAAILVATDIFKSAK
jgi:quercetin dioxygenase-like cupin family protein